MMNHSCVYTLKDKNHVSVKYHDRKCTFVCLQSVSAEALLTTMFGDDIKRTSFPV